MFKDRDLDLLFICALKAIMLKSQVMNNDIHSELVATRIALLFPNAVQKPKWKLAVSLVVIIIVYFNFAV